MKKLALAAAAFLPTLASAAGLLGTTVDLRYSYHTGSLTLDTLDSLLVAAGAEISCPGSAQVCQVLNAPTQTLDFGDSSIRWDYVGLNGATSGFDLVTVNRFNFDALFGSDTVITGVTLDTSVAGLDAGTRLSFSAHSVQLDMRGLALGSQAFFQLNLQTAPVPEPASAALLLGGLAWLAARRRG